MRSGSAHSKRDGEPSWSYERQEAEARTRLIEAEAHRVLSESKCIDAEGRRLEAERVDLEVGVYRKAAYSIVALGISLIVFVHLLLDPVPLSAGGGIGIAALLGWFAKRVGGPD